MYTRKHTRIFMAALFVMIIIENWRLPKCPSKREGINYSTVHSYKCNAKSWKMNLQDTATCINMDESKNDKNTQSMIPFILSSETK